MWGSLSTPWIFFPIYLDLLEDPATNILTLYTPPLDQSIHLPFVERAVHTHSIPHRLEGGQRRVDPAPLLLATPTLGNSHLENGCAQRNAMFFRPELPRESHPSKKLQFFTHHQAPLLKNSHGWNALECPCWLNKGLCFVRQVKSGSQQCIMVSETRKPSKFSGKKNNHHPPFTMLAYDQTTVMRGCVGCKWGFGIPMLSCSILRHRHDCVAPSCICMQDCTDCTTCFHENELFCEFCDVENRHTHK